MESRSSASPSADDSAAAAGTIARGTSNEPHDHTHWHRQRRDQAGLDLGTGSEAKLPIALEDHELDHVNEAGSVWPKSIVVHDYAIVGGNAIGGSYVVWPCTVETLDGGPITIRKRYSDFDSLRKRLVKIFPDSGAAMPLLPRKSMVSRFNEQFLERRKIGLVYFLNCVLLNPEFAGSPVLKDFLLT